MRKLIAFRDWTNNIARAATYDDLFYKTNSGHGLYVFANRAIFTDVGRANAARLAGDAPIFATTRILHVESDINYDTTEFEWTQAEGQLLKGKFLLNDTGEPSIRWLAPEEKNNTYHQDPAAVRGEVYASLVADFAERFNVQGIFVDYLAEKPWTYPNHPTVTLPDSGAMWIGYQIAFLSALKKRGLKVIANGPWAMSQPLLQLNGFIDGVFWEAIGARWSSEEQVIERLMSLRGMLNYHIYEGRASVVGRRFSHPTLAATLAATLGGFCDLKYERGDTALIREVSYDASGA